MNLKFTLLALFALNMSQINAQSTQVPNEGDKVTFLRAITPQSQLLSRFTTTSSWQDNADVSWYNVSSTQFVLTTAEQVAGLAKLVNNGNSFSGKTISINENIDFSAHLWIPIGKNDQFPFSGIFKGNNKTITNIQINLESQDFVGFFGQVYQGQVENITIQNATILGRDTVGGLVANLSTNSSVNNCHTKNVTLTALGYNAGGLVGGLLTDSSISNSSAEGTITGVNQIGGLVGTLWDQVTITKSFAKGTVTGQYIIGGFAGFSTMTFLPNRNNTITDSYTRANVNASIERVGGFYGGPQYNAITSNVYSTGMVSNVDASGGFAGFTGYMSASNIYYDYTNAPIEAVGMFEGPPATYTIQGLPTEQMTTQTLADNLNAGRSVTIWHYDLSKNDGYPILDNEVNLNINDFLTLSSIQIYPSIVTDLLFVKSTDTKINYQIIDYNGRMIKQGIIKDGKINVSSLQSGQYIVLIDLDGKKTQQKFIKK